MGMETHLEDHVFTVNTNQSYNITCYMFVIYFFQSKDNIFILFRISFIELFSFPLYTYVHYTKYCKVK